LPHLTPVHALLTSTREHADPEIGRPYGVRGAATRDQDQCRRRAQTDASTPMLLKSVGAVGAAFARPGLDRSLARREETRPRGRAITCLSRWTSGHWAQDKRRLARRWTRGRRQWTRRSTADSQPESYQDTPVPDGRFAMKRSGSAADAGRRENDGRRVLDPPSASVVLVATCCASPHQRSRKTGNVTDAGLARLPCSAGSAGNRATRPRLRGNRGRGERF
jgi:hypothetical protein